MPSPQDPEANHSSTPWPDRLRRWLAPAAPPPAGPPTRVPIGNNFDFVRVMAALFVLYSHQLALTGRPEPSVLNVHSLGGLGVLIFFSLSGYLVAQSWNADPHALRFAARRLLRIWPGFAGSVLLCTFVVGPLASPLAWRDYLASPGPWYHLSNLQFRMREMLPVRFEGSVLPAIVNGSLWTIPIELKCYALLGLLGLLGVLRRRWLLLALTLALLTEYAVLQPRGDRLVAWLSGVSEPRFTVEFALFFLAGVLLQRFGLVVAGRTPWALMAMAAGFGGVAYLAGRPLITLWAVVPAFTLAIGSAATPVLRRAGRFGDLSYGLYLYAFPMQQLMIASFHDRLPGWAVLLLAALSTTTMAFVSWHAIEKHALRWKPRRPATARPPIAAAGAV